MLFRSVLPYVTVMATLVILVSLPIAWLAQRLADGDGGGGG